MKLIQLEYFAAIVEHGGFVAASKALHVAQPALTRQINDLEYELKTRLLDRGRLGSKLTDPGRNFYNRVRFILEQVEIAKIEAGSKESNPVGEVRVALPVTISEFLAPELVQRVEKNYPLVSVSIIDGTGRITGEIIETGRVDFGLLPNAAKLSNTHFVPLVEEDLYLVSKKQDGEANNDPIPLAQLNKVPLVLTGRNLHIRQYIEEAFAKAGIQIIPRYEQQSLLTIRSFVRFGLASSVLNWLAVRSLWEEGVVNVRRIVKPELIRIISIAVPANRPLTVAAKAVYDILQDIVVYFVEKGEWKGRLISRESSDSAS
jgi:LysR family nitrogen assimilation transcriptional regulator